MQLKREYINDVPDDVRREEIRKQTVRTWSGTMVDPVRPGLNDVRIDDIAHALSLICRYNGHNQNHYNVAAHSIHVMDRVAELGIDDPHCLLMALLHDAEEAYFGDMASPLKARYPRYVEDGINLRTFIYDKYIPTWDSNRMWLDVVNSADADVYVMERLSFFQSYASAEEDMMKKFGKSPLRWPLAHISEQQFLLEFERLAKRLPK